MGVTRKPRMIRNSGSLPIFIIIPTYMILLFIVSALPDTNDPQDLLNNLLVLVSPKIQNLLHFPAYGLLAWLWICGVRTLGITGWKGVLTGVIVASVYGGALELYQFWVPGRFPSLVDGIYNVLGAALFGWFYGKFKILEISRG